MALSVDQKRLKATKFPPEFDKKVDINKVNLDLMKKWIAGKITNILGDDDDVIVETCFNYIEKDQFPKIKEIQIQLQGFLNKETAPFCKELWDLMLSAQDSPVGVPKELLEAKKRELQEEQLSKVAAEARRSEQKQQDDLIDRFRQNDRSERADRPRGGRFRGGDHRGGRGRDFDRGPPRRDSRSPPRRRSPPPRRERDIYVPGGRGRGRGRDRSSDRRRSPSGSRSGSPPARRSRRSPSSDRSRTPPPRRRRRSPSLDHSRSPPRRKRRSPYPRSRSPPSRRTGHRDRSWSPSYDTRRLHRHSSRASTPRDASNSPDPRLSRSASHIVPRRTRRRSPSDSRSATPVKERRRRRSPSSVADSQGSRVDLKKRKRSVTTSRSRSRSKSVRARRRITRSPIESPSRRELSSED